MSDKYEIRVYVKTGYFKYEVAEMQSAIEHCQLIMGMGVYRRSNTNGEIEFYNVIKCKAIGPNLTSQYQDTFCRT
jgi:hypothetical protein